MGTYTNLILRLELNKQTSPFDILQHLVNGTMQSEITGKELPVLQSVNDVPNLPIDHKFGKTHRWDQIFIGQSLKDNILEIHCSIKKYEDDYNLLIDWLTPHIIKGYAFERIEYNEEWKQLFYKGFDD